MRIPYCIFDSDLIVTEVRKQRQRSRNTDLETLNVTPGIPNVHWYIVFRLALFLKRFIDLPLKQRQFI